MEKIKLKAEIFDIIHKQEMLQHEIMKLQKLKEEKLKELGDGYSLGNTKEE